MSRPKKTESIEQIKTTTTSQGSGKKTTPQVSGNISSPSSPVKPTFDELDKQAPDFALNKLTNPKTPSSKDRGQDQPEKVDYRPLKKATIEYIKPSLTDLAPTPIASYYKGKKAGQVMKEAGKVGGTHLKNLAGQTKKGLETANKIAKPLTNIAKFNLMLASPSTAVIGLAKNALSQIMDSKLTVYSAFLVVGISGLILSIILLGVSSYFYSGAGGGTSAKLNSPILLQINFITDPIGTVLDNTLKKYLSPSTWLQTQSTTTGSLATSVAMNLDFLGLTNPDGTKITESSITGMAGDMVDFSVIESNFAICREMMESGLDQFEQFKTFIKDANDKGIPVLVNTGQPDSKDTQSFLITGYSGNTVFINNPDPNGPNNIDWEWLKNNPYPGDIPFQAITFNLADNRETDLTPAASSASGSPL